MSIPNPGYRATRANRYRRERGGSDPATRRLVMFAAGLAGILVCLVGASTLLGHRSGKIPVVTADSRPIRVRPENPGGMQIDGAENDVFSGGADASNTRLAPPAETPDPNGMRAAVVPPAKPPMPLPVATQVAQQQLLLPPLRPGFTANPGAAVAPGAAPTRPVAASVTAGSPAPAVAAPAPRPLETSAPGPGRAAMVQLAALTTEQAARMEWQHLTARMPGLLTGRQPHFSRIERDGHTLWRLRTAGFVDDTQAKEFCERVRAKGNGCSVADF